MTHEQILSDYPELTGEDIRACLAYAADRERRLVTDAQWSCSSTGTLSFKLRQRLADRFPESSQVRLLGMADADDHTLCTMPKPIASH